MIWIDATRPDWTKKSVEQMRFEARSYPYAMRRAYDWGATRMTFENGRRFERVNGEWVRVD